LGERRRNPTIGEFRANMATSRMAASTAAYFREKYENMPIQNLQSQFNGSCGLARIARLK